VVRLTLACKAEVVVWNEKALGGAYVDKSPPRVMKVATEVEYITVFEDGVKIGLKDGRAISIRVRR